MSDELPGQDEIKEAIDDASELRDKIIEYRQKAQIIDDDFIEQHDEDAQEIYLDLLPYGEELVRTSDLPDALDESIEDLERILNKNITNPKDIIEKFEGALDCIKDARDTLNDCTDLPENEEEKDY
jgi:hypothetical protein